MSEIHELKIYIVEYSKEKSQVLKDTFINYPNIEVINDDLLNFFNKHKDVIDCIVSPANAFGNMSGGFDARISDILGWDFQNKVQQYIKEHFYGEQIVNTSFIIKTHLPHLSLIHTPTMRYPSTILDPDIIYHAMRSSLICALNNNIHHIIIPAFGGQCGNLPIYTIATKMKQAYDQILTKTSINI